MEKSEGLNPYASAILMKCVFSILDGMEDTSICSRCRQLKSSFKTERLFLY